MNDQPPAFGVTATDSQEVVRRFLADLHCGADWLEALLDAIGRWLEPEETVGGRQYRYLVGNEAFDWLLLAERLLSSANGMVPQADQERLLLHGLLPRELSSDMFKERLGAAKYRAVINHWYGVRVEEALVLAVEAEIRKQRRGLRPEEPRLEDAVYEHIYGLPKGELLAAFCQERGGHPAAGLSLRGHEEFTYWLFHYRMKRSDKARLASDTKKGLAYLHRLGRASFFSPPEDLP